MKNNVFPPVAPPKGKSILHSGSSPFRNLATKLFQLRGRPRVNVCTFCCMNKRFLARPVKILLAGAIFTLVLIVSPPAETVIESFSSQEEEFQLVEVVDGLSSPWGMTFLPDGGILVTERSGGVVLVSGGGKTTVRGVPEVAAKGQRGLLDIALHPDCRRRR